MIYHLYHHHWCCEQMNKVTQNRCMLANFAAPLIIRQDWSNIICTDTNRSNWPSCIWWRRNIDMYLMQPPPGVQSSIIDAPTIIDSWLSLNAALTVNAVRGHLKCHTWGLQSLILIIVDRGVIDIIDAHWLWGHSFYTVINYNNKLFVVLSSKFSVYFLLQHYKCTMNLPVIEVLIAMMVLSDI